MDIALIPTDQKSDRQQILLKDNYSFKRIVKENHKLIASIEIWKQHMESNMLSLEKI